MLGILKLIKGIEDSLLNTIAGIESTINYHIIKVRRKITHFIIQMVLLIISVLFILIGAVLFFSRFFPIDGVLLVGGAALLYLSLFYRLLTK